MFGVSGAGFTFFSAELYAVTAGCWKIGTYFEA